MSLFSIGPYEQFYVPVNPDDPYVPIDPPEEGNPFEWVYDHTQTDKQGEPLKTGPWNDRLVNIVRWLPGALQDSNLSEFVALYQELLNQGMYLTTCKWDDSELKTSVLKKIEKILDLRDPSNIDEGFIYKAVELLGFENSDIDALAGSEQGDDKFNKCRELLRSIPYLAANKTTDRDLKQLAAIFGYGVSIDVKKTNSAESYDMGYWFEDGNPTPHFEVVANKVLTKEEKQALENLVESVRPINTVFDKVFDEIWVDPRDEKEYRIKRYYTGLPNGEIWMAQNFNFGETSTDQEYGKTYRTDLALANGDYGGLYTWQVAVQSCPNGWHLPSMGEFDRLCHYFSGSGNTAAKNMKSKPDLWDGKDTKRFSALPNGYLDENEELNESGTTDFIWTTQTHNSSSELKFSDNPDDPPETWYSIEIPPAFNFLHNNYAPCATTGSDTWAYENPNPTEEAYEGRIGVPSALDSKNAVSVRYVKDSGLSYQSSGVFVDDRDGQIYRWMKIGDYYWMVDNLNYGTICSKPGEDMVVGDAWALGNTNPSHEPGLIPLMQGCSQNARSNPYEKDLRRNGKSYNRNIAEGSCPKGWELPSKEQWENLRNALMSPSSTITDYGEKGWRVSEVGYRMKTSLGWLVNGLATTAGAKENYRGDNWFYGLPTGWSINSIVRHGDEVSCWLCYDTYETEFSGCTWDTVQAPTFVTVNSMEAYTIPKPPPPAGGTLTKKDSFMFFYGVDPVVKPSDPAGHLDDIIGDWNMDFGDPDYYAPSNFSVMNPITDIGFAIRCCRSTLPTIHTEEDWHDWYGQD